MEKKRTSVLIINTSMISSFGGQERFADNMVKSLYKKYDVTYIGNFYRENHAFVSKYKKSFSPFKSERLVKLPRIIKRKPLVILLRILPWAKNLVIRNFNAYFDVVISNSSIDDTALLNSGIKYKNIIIIPHSTDLTFKGVYPNNLISNHRFKIIALNTTMLTYLSKLYRKKNVQLIYPVNPEEKRNFLSKFIEKLGITKNTKLLVSVSRLEDKQKKISYAIRAISKIKNRHDLLLVIAGEGKDKTRYAKLIKKLRLDENVKLIGKVSEDEKYSLLKKALIYIQPSAKENFSVSLVEGMRAGAIPIVSINNGSKGLIKNGWNGFFTDIDAEKISSVIQKILNLESDLLQEIRKNVKSSVSNLTFKNMIRSYTKVINSLSE